MGSSLMLYKHVQYNSTVRKWPIQQPQQQEEEHKITFRRIMTRPRLAKHYTRTLTHVQYRSTTSLACFFGAHVAIRGETRAYCTDSTVPGESMLVGIYLATPATSLLEYWVKEKTKLLLAS